MKKTNSVEEYFENNEKFTEALFILRDLLNSTTLEETLKWNMPTYTLKGKNVIGIGAFKHHFCLWFHNGIFLKDDAKRLVNAQEGKTKGMRQMRFESLNDINKNLVLTYIKEAIKNQEMGLVVKPKRTTKKDVVIPGLLKGVLKDNKALNTAFNSLSPSHQREYCNYIIEAKREATKFKRLDKILPMIIESKGLHDKYKNC